MPKWLVVAVRDIPRITNQLKYLKMTKEEKIQDVYEKLGFEQMKILGNATKSLVKIKKNTSNRTKYLFSVNVNKSKYERIEML